MRNRFNEQLEQLNVELIKMGALCEEAISAATKAYVEGDRELGERARSLEQDIDHKERDIESQCMKLLLRQQPVAKDLRAVSAALGHSQTSTTLNIYAHTFETAQARAADALADALPVKFGKKQA